MFNLRAPAKINLILELVGKRADGYHDLVSVVQTVTLFDVLTFASVPGLHFEVNDPALQADNLVEKAARLLAEKSGIAANASITLEKHIPVGAGLGGGSSDAAATLVGLAELWELDLDCADLLELAEELGSDVPFFLYQGTALIESKGERVRHLSKPNSNWYLLVNPGFELSTASAYGAVTEEDLSDGRETMHLVEAIGGDSAPSATTNRLQAAALRVSPETSEFLEALNDRSDYGFVLSGSGPTAFAVFDSQEEAEDTAERISPMGYWQEVVTDYIPAEGAMPCA